MKKFNCKIVRENGEVYSEVISSGNLSNLKQIIEDRGEFLVSNELVKNKIKKSKVSTRDIYIFTRELHILLKSGMSLFDSLKVLRDQVENQMFKDCLSNVSEGLQQGRNFSDTLSDYNHIFSSFYINSLIAGEKSGNMIPILEKLGYHEKRMYRLKEKMIKVFTYPLILLLVSMSVLMFMIFYVVPTFNLVFEDLNVKLPFITEKLMWISTFVKHNFIVIGISILVFLILGFLLGKMDSIKLISLKLILKLPFVGSIYNRFNISKFAATLSLLLSGGIPIVDSMKIVSGSVSKGENEKKMIASTKLIIQGKSLSVALKEVELFDEMAVQMVSIGEKSGSLSVMLDAISEIYEEEIDHEIELLSAIIEPVLLVVMGSIIAFIVISVFIPVISMSTAF